MRITNDFLNGTSASSLSMQATLSDALLKSIDIYATFNDRTVMHHSQQFSMECHPMPGQEFLKLQQCYKEAMWMATEQHKATDWSGLRIEIAYVDCDAKETKVTLTPYEVIVDLTHLT